jgi:hypothetical protein
MINQIETSQKPMEANQEQFIKHFNEQGKPMISAPDCYKAIKEGKIESIKQALEHYLITSSRIDQKNQQIIHYAESKWEYKINVKIPNLSGNFQENKETEAYLQALFNTEDNLETILKVLKSSGKEIIRLWTSSDTTSIRAVVLFFNGVRFVIYGDYYFSYVGFSHSVSIDSAKQSIINPKNKLSYDEDTEKDLIQFKQITDRLKKKGWTINILIAEPSESEESKCK